MSDNEYKCAMCGGVFGKTWTDEEALVETEEYFGKGWKQEYLDVVCDDCFNKIHPAEHPVEVEISKREKPVEPSPELGEKKGKL